MNSSFVNRVARALGIAITLLCSFSCVSVDDSLGSLYIPTDQQYRFFVNDDIPLDEIYMKQTDSLSGFSSTRISVGAIRDEEFGLTKRCCAITLVPLLDTLDYGKDPSLYGMYVYMVADSVSVADRDKQHILQSIGVHELDEKIDTTKFNINGTIKYKPEYATYGNKTILYNGFDSLSFQLSKEIAEKYMHIEQSDLKDLDTYLTKFPGLYFETDEPMGNGGRFNMFTVKMDYDFTYSYITGNFAMLSFNAEYDGERKDTSFYFWFSPDSLMNVDSLLSESSSNEDFPQHALNITVQEKRSVEGLAKDKIYVEGGGGLKPVIPASEIKRLIEADIKKNGGKVEDAILSRVTIELPFEFPDDYQQMFRYPEILTPVTRIKKTNNYLYAGISDTSNSAENQGDCNRSRLVYAPDITFHAQEILRKEEKDLSTDYDVWLMIMANEIRTVVNSGNSSLSDYYSYLAYASYYGDTYSSYGGYGYGGYGDQYSNYYSYMMAAAYAGQSTTSTETSTELDKLRFYGATLNGPEATDGLRKPKLKIAYTLPKE